MFSFSSFPFFWVRKLIKNWGSWRSWLLLVRLYSWFKRLNEDLVSPPPVLVAVKAVWPQRIFELILISLMGQIYSKAWYAQERGTEINGFCLLLKRHQAMSPLLHCKYYSVISSCLSQVQNKWGTQFMFFSISLIRSSPT